MMCARAVLDLEKAAMSPTERRSSKILDFGAGSGLVGEFLNKQGYQDVHA